MPAAEEEGPEPTQEQILAVRKAMNLESQNAIDEGLEQTENGKKTQLAEAIKASQADLIKLDVILENLQLDLEYEQVEKDLDKLNKNMYN